MRIQFTLTGDRAEQYLERKERLEERLGYEMTHPEAVGLLMNPAVCDEIVSSRAIR